MKELLTILEDMDDPRLDRKKLHPLTTILGIGLCCLLSDGEDFIDMEEYGKNKQEMLKDFFDIKNGIPSHDTFRRVFGMIDVDKLGAILVAFSQKIAGDLTGKQICIDGKGIRGTRDFGKRGNTCLTILSAFVSENKLVIAQKSVDKKSNEIMAIPDILAQINLKNTIITLDAMGCQRNVAQIIDNGGGNYFLAVKENQPTLHKEIVDYFEQNKALLPTDTTRDIDHGRIETRTCTISEDLKTIHMSPLWSGLKTIIKIESIRDFKNKKKIETQTRYYISNAKQTPKKANCIARKHWGIENNLHWQLDVTFREDNNTVVDRISSHNLNTLRKLCLQILEQDKTPKLSKKSKRKRAGWNDEYLFELLKNIKITPE